MAYTSSIARLPGIVKEEGKKNACDRVHRQQKRTEHGATLV